MIKMKTYACRVPEGAVRTGKESTFVGHLVECTDLDSRDVFVVEVLINQNFSEIQAQEKAIEVASKANLVVLTGNSFEYEYIQPSGKIISVMVEKFRTELSPTSAEAEEMLNNYEPG